MIQSGSSSTTSSFVDALDLKKSCRTITKYPRIGEFFTGGTDFQPTVLAFCSQEQHTKQLSDGPVSTEKLIVVGDHSAGKTCLIRRFCQNEYTDGYKATIGVDFMYKHFNILGMDFTLHIWDTAGQEQFKCISKQYYRGAAAVIVAFDLQSEESFDHAQIWYEEVERENRSSEKTSVFLVGLKSDLYHVVTDQQAQHMAARMNAEYWKTSAKSCSNVQELFDRVAVALFEKAVQRKVAVNSRRPENQQHNNETNLEIGSGFLLADERSSMKPEKKRSLGSIVDSKQCCSK